MTEKEKDLLKALNDYVHQVESVMPEVLREMKEKGFKTPNVEGQKPTLKARARKNWWTCLLLGSDLLGI